MIVTFLTMIISTIRVIVNLKVIQIATRGSLASTVTAKATMTRSLDQLVRSNDDRLQK